MSCLVCFFFFKQKTAYEMRISDWSSDVCSSDLRIIHHPLNFRSNDFLYFLLDLKVISLHHLAVYLPDHWNGLVASFFPFYGVKIVLYFTMERFEGDFLLGSIGYHSDKFPGR